MGAFIPLGQQPAESVNPDVEQLYPGRSLSSWEVVLISGGAPGVVLRNTAGYIYFIGTEH